MAGFGDGDYHGFGCQCGDCAAVDRQEERDQRTRESWRRERGLPVSDEDWSDHVDRNRARNRR